MAGNYYKKVINFFTGATRVKNLEKNITAEVVSFQASDMATARDRQFGGAKWYGGLSDSGRSLTLNHSTLRRNTRDNQVDSVLSKTITSRMVDTIVDTGLVYEPEPVASIIGKTAEEVEAWSDDVGTRFHLWMASQQATLAENQTGYQQQWLAGQYQQRDNDFFVLFNYSDNPNLLSPLQIKIIDPDALVGQSYTNTDGYQNNTDDGIERDANGKETAFWVRVKNRKGQYKDKRIPAFIPGTNRRRMIHIFRPEYADQGRGFSLDAHLLQDSELLQDFKLSHIKKAINQASTVMYVEPSDDKPASNPFEGHTNSYSGPVGMTTTDDGGTLTAADEEYLRYTDMPEAAISRPGSVGVFSLQGGEKLKSGDQNTPIESYDKFVDAFAAYLCASRGMPIETMLMRFNQNYSASRATLVLAWRIAIMWRYNLTASMLDLIFEAWISEEIAAGRVAALGWSDPRMKAAWLNGRWNGSPMPDIDPLKHAKASKEFVELGATNLDEVALKQGGTHNTGKANRAKLKRQFKELPPVPWGQSQQNIGGPPNDQS